MNIEKLPLGHQKLECFMLGERVKRENFSMAFIGAGQCGSKIASEFIRMGYYGFLYNTCKEDLDSTCEILEQFKELEIQYDALHLTKGENGASKNREEGKKAILENQNDLITMLKDNKKIIDADFVWICVGLGGGTGNGSLKIVASFITKLRASNRYKKRTKVGIIATVPESNSLHQIEINSGEATKEIRQLQKDNMLGVCMMVDNEKLVKDYLESNQQYKEWTTFGNLLISRILVEAVNATSLKGSEVFDKSECLDVLTEPAILSIAKKNIDKKVEQEDINKIAKSLLGESNVLAKAYDNNYITKLATIIIKPKNSKIMTDDVALRLRHALKEQLVDSITEVDYFGIMHTTTMGEIGVKTEAIEHKDGALIYTLTTNLKSPIRVIEATKHALLKKDQKEQRLKDLDDELLTLNIEQKALTEDVSQEIRIDDDFDLGIFDTKPIDERPIIKVFKDDEDDLGIINLERLKAKSRM